MSSRRTLRNLTAAGVVAMLVWFLASSPHTSTEEAAAPPPPPLLRDRRLALGLHTDRAGLLPLLRPAASAASADVVARVEGPGCDALDLRVEDLAGKPVPEGAARVARRLAFPEPERLPGERFPTWTSERTEEDGARLAHLRTVARGRLLYVIQARTCGAPDVRAARIEALLDVLDFEDEAAPDPSTVLPDHEHKAPGVVANPLLTMDGPLGLAAIGEDGWTTMAGPMVEAELPGARVGMRRPDGTTVALLPLGASRRLPSDGGEVLGWWDEPVHLHKVASPHGWHLAGRLASRVPWAWIEAWGPGREPDLEAVGSALSRVRPLDDETRRRLGRAAAPPEPARYASGVAVANGWLLDVARGVTWQFDPLVWSVQPTPEAGGAGAWVAHHLSLPVRVEAGPDPDARPDVRATETEAALLGRDVLMALAPHPGGLTLARRTPEAVTLAVPGIRLAAAPGAQPVDEDEGGPLSGWPGYADGPDEVRVQWVATPLGGLGPEASAERLLRRALAGLGLDAADPETDQRDADLMPSARLRTWSGLDGTVHAWTLVRGGAGVVVLVRDAPPVRPVEAWRALVTREGEPPLLLAVDEE